MGTWKTELINVKNDIGSTFSSGINQLKDMFTGTVGKTIDSVSSLFGNGSTVVGINVNQIENMKTAVRNYTNNIDQILAKLDVVETGGAFKGTYADAIKEYIVAVKETCGAVTSNMLAFNDKLDEIKLAYEQKDDQSKSRIMSNAETTRSSFTKYTEGR